MSLIQLSIEEWTQRAKFHQSIIFPITNAFIQRRSMGKKHPVHDFLFTYYSCSPAKLQQWIPSVDMELEWDGALRENFFWLKEGLFEQRGNYLSLKLLQASKNLFKEIQFIIELCKNILDRPPRFGCFGLHEWAMVYKLTQEGVRHQDNPLRLKPKEIEDFVKSQFLCCTHYDAYRFFTPESKPLNVFQPTLNSRLQMEQGGCIHANMDLYKWSVHLWPWIGSDFIRKTFFHALEGRELDMKASPYDLMSYGYSPILIESEQGRKYYQEQQQIYASKAQGLRQELLKFCEGFMQKFT